METVRSDPVCVTDVCAKDREKHRNEGFYMSFEACERSNFTISVLFKGFGIAGMVQSNYCKSLIFIFLDKLVMTKRDSYSCDSSFLRGVNSPYIIYNYLYIN